MWAINSRHDGGVDGLWAIALHNRIEGVYMRIPVGDRAWTVMHLGFCEHCIASVKREAISLPQFARRGYMYK